MAASDAQRAAIIRAAQEQGVDPATALAIAERESNFNPAARSSKTIAGMYQMRGDLRQQYGVGDTNDPYQQAKGWAPFFKDTKATMSKALGRDVTDAEGYAGHHFGAGRAARMLQMDPATPVDQVFTPYERSINPHFDRAGNVGNLLSSVTGDIDKRRAKFGGSTDDGPLDVSNLETVSPAPSPSLDTSGLEPVATASAQPTAAPSLDMSRLEPVLMTDKFEDGPPTGSGYPTVDQVVETREYLKRRNRNSGITPVMDEMIANGFDISHASVGRALKDKPGGEVAARKKIRQPESANKPKRDVRYRAKKNAKQGPEKATLESLTPAEVIILKDIIGDWGNLKKNCDIALVENKVRMALNIILMRRLIERPELMLIDMRGAAALIDSMTISSKVSGGASFEVIAPGDKPEVDGNGMKDITPKPQVASIQAFRRFRENGKGT